MSSTSDVVPTPANGIAGKKIQPIHVALSTRRCATPSRLPEASRKVARTSKACRARRQGPGGQRAGRHPRPGQPERLSSVLDLNRHPPRGSARLAGRARRGAPALGDHAEYRGSPAGVELAGQPRDLDLQLPQTRRRGALPLVEVRQRALLERRARRRQAEQADRERAHIFGL